MTTRVEPIAANLWGLSFPLNVVGVPFGRNVTIIRLSSGELIIHSTAPFTPEDVDAIRGLGEPGWLLDVTLLHDTFAKRGRNAFPHLPYLAPEGFAKRSRLATYPLNRLLPPAWKEELDILQLSGMPRVREHTILHRGSRTLIVADLIFNWKPTQSRWGNFVRRRLMAIHRFPGVSRWFRWSIKDRKAFLDSMSIVMSWDFDRVIVGHGEIIETGGKEKLQSALQDARLCRSTFS
jgi:hypothetical protein